MESSRSKHYDLYILYKLGAGGLPDSSPENGQITLEMQAAVSRLQAEQAAAQPTDEELEQAARDLAESEGGGAP